MPTRPEHLAHAAASLIAVFGFARIACAQTALGDGTRLDRNARVGGGGRNPAGPDIRAQIRLNEAIMTGNAPLGRSFQGNVGYLATEDFRGSLGSNSLFRFSRDSAGSEFFRGGIRGTDALQYQFALATGQAPPSLVSGLGGYVSRSGAGTVNIAGAGPLRSASDFTTQRSLRPSIVGYRSGQDGRMYAVMASPLLGLQALPILASPLYAPTEVTSRLSPGDSQTPAGAKPVAPGEPAPISGEPARQRPTAGLTGIEAPGPGLVNPLVASRIIDRSAPSTRVDAEVPAAVSDRFREALKEEKVPADEPEAGGADPTNWQAELDRIRQQLSGAQAGGKEPTAADPRPPSGDSTPPTAPPTAPPQREPQPGATDKPALPSGTPGRAEDRRNDEAAAGNRRDGALARLPERVRKLVEPQFRGVDPRVLTALERTKPVIDRLSPADSAPGGGADPAARSPMSPEKKLYATYMTSGEQMLSREKYFEAEERFLRALAAVPNDPMASIGRVHAQLGAALYLSAAMNLRALIGEHPQMAGARYSRSLFPSGQRCDAIAAFFRENIKSKESGLGRDAGLLLAYLGYQLQKPATMREGLDAMAVMTDDDDQAGLTLLGLLERVWAAPANELPPAPAAEK